LGKRRNRHASCNRFPQRRFESLEPRWVLATISVNPGLDTLPAAVSSARPGDTLSLKSGVYLISETVEIDKNLTIRGSSSNAEMVHIAAVEEDFIGNHIVLVLPSASKASFANFTVQGAAESPTDDPEQGGDGIHLQDVEYVNITNVHANINGASGIYIDGAESAELDKVVAMANGAFGIDVNSARKLTIGDSQVVGNGIGGIQATGDDQDFTSLTIKKSVATANHETGISVDSFKHVTLKNVTASDNGEDGFSAEDVGRASIEDSTFANNLDDGLQLIEVDRDTFEDSKIYGNRDQRIERSQVLFAQASLATAQRHSRRSNSITVHPGLDTIQAAIDDAEAGETLYLKPGLYLISDTVEIDKNLTIKGSSLSADQTHIVPVIEDFMGDHIFSVLPEVERISFANFTVKGGAESETDSPEGGGDGIHTEGVEYVTITNVQASLNGANGIFTVGAVNVTLDKVVAVANGAFGFDTDSTLQLTVRNSSFLANGISGLEAAGHDTPSVTFTAMAFITNTIAKANGEIGIELERFKNATLESVTCSNNFEDGFDADRLHLVAISESSFANNLGDGLELFPVDAAEPPPDFPFDILEKFKKLKIFGNRLEGINHPDTEN
jgi:hypothetical protein